MTLKILTLKNISPNITKNLMKNSWPNFMVPKTKTLKNWNLVKNKWPEYQLCLFEDNQLIGVLNSTPIYFDFNTFDLPQSWGEILILGINSNLETINTLVATNIVIDYRHRKKGYSRLLIKKLKQIAFDNNFGQLLVPARPIFKESQTRVSLENYIYQQNEHGLSKDKWIRTHQKLGADIIKLMPKSFVVKATIKQWEIWTNSSFEYTGSYTIPGALEPLYIDVEKNTGVYHDPNVWLKYDIDKKVSS